MRRILGVFAIMAMVAVNVGAQAPQMPKPGPEQQALTPFIGTWTFEGVAKDSPMGPGGKMTGTDRISWLPGGFFAQRQFEGTGPMGKMQGVEIFGWDAIKKAYSLSYFESTGVMGSGTMTAKGNVWTGTSTAQMGTMVMHQRCTLTFSAGNATLNIRCDMSTDGGKTFATAFEGTAKKAGK